MEAMIVLQTLLVNSFTEMNVGNVVIPILILILIVLLVAVFVHEALKRH